MVNLAIFGSCITRDAFNFSKDSYEISTYFARTSIISSVSNPLIVEESNINLSSAFQIKCIKQDLEKTFFSKIQENEIEYLIIDFIDERFNLLKIDESIITKSNELVASGMMDQYDFIEIQRNEELLPLWKESAKVFFNQLVKYIPANRIILHKGLWKTKYIDENGSIAEFTNQLNYIESQNKLLNEYYRFIEDNFNKINVIDLTGKELKCTVHHRWGLSPYHFEDNYYKILLEKLDLIVNANSETTNFADLFSRIEKSSTISFEKDRFIHKISNNEIPEKLILAYYVKFDSQIKLKQWYSSERFINFSPKEKGEYEIIIFLRNEENKDDVQYFSLKINL